MLLEVMYNFTGYRGDVSVSDVGGVFFGEIEWWIFSSIEETPAFTLGRYLLCTVTITYARSTAAWGNLTRHNS